jgi:mannose-6-phosphate isomerase
MMAADRDSVGDSSGGRAPPARRGPQHAAQLLQGELQRWLVGQACPLWSRAGVDAEAGGFHERLDTDGTPLHEQRRARVQPRQAYAFARAREVGWQGDAAALVEAGLLDFRNKYRRPDGLYRTLVAPDGTPLNDAALLYDQAFALLGFAAARRLVGPGRGWEQEGAGLFALLQRFLRRPDGGYDSGLPMRLPLLGNPQMHLFEALLDWRELDRDATWRDGVEELGTLALAHLIDAQSGLVYEIFSAGWARAPGLEGRLIEPGHLFEWGWLLLRWNSAPQSAPQAAPRAAALRLIELGERCLSQRGLVVDSMFDDFSVLRPTARLWPQTERLKANALAAALTGEERYWLRACEAARSLQAYLRTPLAGLWYDQAAPDGAFVSEPAPASSFYHIVTAILVLTDALQSDASTLRSADKVPS